MCPNRPPAIGMLTLKKSSSRLLILFFIGGNPPQGRTSLFGHQENEERVSNI
jgi:hypothetical protein